MIRQCLPILLCGLPLFCQTKNDQAAWTLLDNGFKDTSASTRANAAHAASLLRNNSRARIAVESLLSDKDANVRAQAASSLGRMGAKSSVPKILKLFDDQEPEVVFAATAALHDLHDPRAYSVYYAALTGERKTGQSLVESQMKIIHDPKAIAKLGFQGGLSFVPFGNTAFRVYETVTKDDASPIRAAAALRLADDPDPRSGKALVAALKDPKWLVRAAAADALGQRNNRTLRDPLAPLFSDENELVRMTAAAAYLRLTPSRAK